MCIKPSTGTGTIIGVIKLVTFFFTMFATFLMLGLVKAGGRPAVFALAEAGVDLGEGQTLECRGNFEGVDVVIPSCI